MAYNPRTSEFLVNIPTAGNQLGPSVTRLANGNILAVYATPTTAAATQNAIQGQYFDSVGNRIGSFFWITDFTIRGQLEPDVASLPDGSFATTWVWFTSGGSNIKMKFGTAGVEPLLDFGNMFSVNNPEIAGLSNGSAAVVWWDDMDFDPTVNGAIVAPGGTVQSFSIVTNEGGAQGRPQIATLNGGNFVVAWDDTSGVGGDSDGTAVKAQIFDSAGNKFGPELLANTTTAGSQSNPYVAALPGGGFVIVWDGGGQIFDALGNKIGGEFAVAAGGNIGVRSDGGFVVVYVAADGDQNGIYAQQYAADGSAVGGPVLVNSVTSGNQIDPDAVMLVNDELFVTWQDNSGVGGDTDGNGIKGRILSPSTFGTENADVFTGTASLDDFQGQGGNDTFYLQQGGDDRAGGGNGDDTFYFGNAYTSADRVDGGAGNDRLVLQGRYGNLQLNAQSLVNVETILLLTASNNAFGGSGPNSTFYSIKSVDANVAAGSSLLVDGRQLAANEYLNFDGSAESDGSFFLYGGAAVDTLTGGAGRDTLDGGTGNDTLAGGANDDIYFVDHPADIVNEAVGGGNFDAVYSRVNYVLRAGSEVELLAATGLGLGQAIALTGNEFSQSLVSGSGNDDLNGGGGADFLTANAGNDRLNGGTGIDQMNGGAGNDIYFVDNLSDTVVELAGGGTDSVYASTTYQLSGGAEVELLATTGLTPGQAITLFGNDFAQSIIGASGDDTLLGFGGNDSLVGNEGADILDGGAGNDGLRGDAGADIFRFVSVSDSTGAGDNIFDFLSGTDKIDLSQIDANTNVDGNHAFTFIGGNAFSGTAAELRVESSGGLVNVYGDVNGDGAADLIIHLYNTGGVMPVAGDFVL
ncbi:MAG TPA: calcium-binding protein [Allosphingosinicella sp.]